MSACSRCGAPFTCAMADGADPATPCWCVSLPAVVPVPALDNGVGAACWCPACLRDHIAELETPLRRDPGAQRLV
ncbi:MAG TPA: cysteine-rich CWC family protein [Telluria sp.]|nr:cysteine-rich CWC family protein [Telluria sp.]